MANHWKQWPRGEWITLILLFVGLSSFYFATVSGITSSNDGSHYALARTMVENHAFALKQFDDYAEGNDIAVREGVLYSDRPPGTAVLSTLFYTLGGRLPAPRSRLPSRHDADNPRLLYVLLLPVWAGAGTAVLLYLFLRGQNVTRVGAVTAVLLFSLGTAQWKYSAVLFSHALSGFLVLLAVFLAAHAAPSSRWGRYLLLGFVLGFAVLVEYSNGLLVIIVGLFVLSGIRPFTPRRILAVMGPFVMGGLVPAAFLAYYNNVNFGSPFTLSYAYAVNYPWAGSFFSTFSWPLLPGLRALLIWGEGGGWCDPTCVNQGLFLLSPVMLLALPGVWFYFRRARVRRQFWLTNTVFVIYLLLFAKHFTSHGFTGDGRYLVPFLSLLAIPLAYTLDWSLTQFQKPARQFILTGIIFGLFFLSWRNMFLHIGFSYNYHLDLSRLDRMIASPQNWRYLGHEIFRNTGNLPLFWLLEGVGLGVGLIWSRYRGRGLGE